MIMRCPQCKRQNLIGECPAHHFECTATSPDVHFPGYVNPCGEVATSTTGGKLRCGRHYGLPT